MRSKMNVLYCLAAVLMMLPLTGCPIGSKDAGTPAAGGTGSGGTLSTSDLAGTWDSGHISRGSMKGRSTGLCYREMMSISGNTFSWNRSWYSLYTNGYCDGTSLGDESISGTVAVGQPLSSSSNVYSIQFTTGASQVRAYNATERNEINSACAINLTSSSYITTTGNPCGGLSSYISFANSGVTVNNIVSSTGGQMQLGAFSTSTFVPGVVAGGSVPASTSLTLIRR